MKQKNTIRISTLVMMSSIFMLSSSYNNDGDDDNTVKDIDGNIYDTITIGSQTWMKENLKTTRYNNGDLIGTTSPATLDIMQESAPKYQWAYDGNDSNVAIYGRLYTWDAAIDTRGICPKGWHVANYDEWETLINFLGGEDVAGGKLKEIDTIHWICSYNVGISNESGFTALPGGLRHSNEAFLHIGYTGYWWVPYEDTSKQGQYILMHCSLSGVLFYPVADKGGLSVRCIKD